MEICADMDQHFESIRREYIKRSLARKEMPNDPFEKVSQWLKEAIDSHVLEPTAVIVATATADGRPSMRTVLLKEILNNQFIFYSNYTSRKGGANGGKCSRCTHVCVA